VFFLIVVFNYNFVLSQNISNDSIQMYFSKIEKLVNERNSFKDDFLDEVGLLAKKENSKGKEEIFYLLKLYKVNKYKSVEKAYNFNDEALRLSQEIGYKKGELSAKSNHAYLQFINGLFNESMNAVLEIEKEINFQQYPDCYSDLNSLKSYIYTERGEYDLALDTGLKLLDKGEKSKNQYVLMRAYSSLSHYYLRIENFKTALSYCLKGLDCVINLKDIQYIFPKIDEIARMSAKLNDIETAFEAYAYYLELETKIQSPGSFIQSVVYMNIADISIHNNEFEKAQNYLSQALELNVVNNYRFRIPRALILQAELNLKTKDTLNAIINYEKSIDAAEAINAFDVVKSNSAILAKLYRMQNNFAKLYEYNTLFTAIRDSLFNNEKEQKIIILEARRKIKEVTQKKKILELENIAQKAKFHSIIILLFFVLLISLFVAYAYLKVKGKNKLLYHRTIELAEIQLKLREQLNEIEKTKSKLNVKSEDGTSQKSSNIINDDIKDIILSKLEKLEENLFFIDQNCTLNQMAQQLKTNPKYLSQVINQEKKCHFNNYINELRINYLLGRLITDEEFRESKLSYISASIGYNNLNTFNAAFKKRQGILPSYFISELMQESKNK